MRACDETKPFRRSAPQCDPNAKLLAVRNFLIGHDLESAYQHLTAAGVEKLHDLTFLGREELRDAGLSLVQCCKLEQAIKALPHLTV
jgi:hypothetical protein